MSIGSMPWWLTTTVAVAVSAIEAVLWRGHAVTLSRIGANFRQKEGAEGRSRFARGPSTGSLSAPAPAPAPAPARPAPDATVQAIQRKLNELGYSAGPADGLMGRGTRAAIIASAEIGRAHV